MDVKTSLEEAVAYFVRKNIPNGSLGQYRSCVQNICEIENRIAQLENQLEVAVAVGDAHDDDYNFSLSIIQNDILLDKKRLHKFSHQLQQTKHRLTKRHIDPILSKFVRLARHLCDPAHHSMISQELLSAILKLSVFYPCAHLESQECALQMKEYANAHKQVALKCPQCPEKDANGKKIEYEIIDFDRPDFDQDKATLLSHKLQKAAEQVLPDIEEQVREEHRIAAEHVRQVRGEHRIAAERVSPGIEDHVSKKDRIAENSGATCALTKTLASIAVKSFPLGLAVIGAVRGFFTWYTVVGVTAIVIGNLMGDRENEDRLAGTTP